MNAIILSVGDELTLGQTVDTNSAWISQQLAAVGCDVAEHRTVSDDQRAIERAIGDAAARCDALIVSGGIGPTPDDLTRQALAVVMDAPLEMNASWLEVLEGFFAKRGRPMPDMNRIQAMIPRGAKLVFNHAGTAAGIHAVLARGASACDVFVMPGVPKEMKAMFARDVLPHVEAKGGGAVILSATLHTFGVGESSVAEILGDLMDRGRSPSVGTTVAAGQVSLRINARFENREVAGRKLEETVALCEARLGSLIFGRDDQTLAQVVAGLLRGRAKTVATAESCTGGLVAKLLTDMAGSSEYFVQGWVTYTNASKTKQLGVPAELIPQHGAVSTQVVEAMARGAIEASGADLAVAISGVAGPGGGTEQKPVGTVHIGLAWKESGSGVSARMRVFNFPGDREWVRERSAKMALALLRYHLLGEGVPF